MANRWIATGLSRDLPPGVVMAGRWQDAELAVWRSVSGKLAAWKDRCPHRGMRLSHGFVRGETLACIYHGWVYGTDGACRHIPAHPALTPPEAIRTEAFRCAESDGVIWLAPAGHEAPPPRLPGLRPLRSFPLNAPVRALLDAEPALSGTEILSGRMTFGRQAADVTLLVQPWGETVMLHALVSAEADPVQASRWLEDLRRRAEERVAA